MAVKKPEYVAPAKVQKARLAAGLTQTQAASRIGYSWRAWQEWEAGRRNMRRVLFDAFLAAKP